MDTETDKPKRRTYRRPSTYAKPVAVKLLPDMLADIERTADKHDLSLAELLRRCVSRGFPYVRDSLRKAAERDAKGADKGADNGADNGAK